MKQLCLVRHAKSSWSDPRLADFDRPLNKRGKRNAPLLGKRLREYKICPDLLISSGAKRARQTAQIIAQEMGYAKPRIILSDALYTADRSALVELVRTMDQGVNSLMLVGHNFVITEFAEWLSGSVLGNIPTSGAACIECDASWETVAHGSGTLVFFDYPSLHKDESGAA